MDIMQYLPQFSQNTTQDQMPQDDAMMQLELQRRMKFADALRNQAPPEGQMVSGHYVAPSWTQQLANLANKYVAGQQEQNAMKQYGDYQTAKAKKYGDLMIDLAKGKATTTTDNTPFQIQVPGGQSTQTENLGGMQPIGSKTIDVPMTNTSSTYKPYSQQEYMARILQTMPELAPKFLENDISNKFKQHVPQKVGANEAIGIFDESGKFIPSYTNTVAKDKAHWSAPYSLGGQTVQKNLDTDEIRQAITLPPQTKIEVNANANKSYATNLAEGMAKSDLEAIDAARSAPQRLNTARRVKEVLSSNPITGTGAEAKLAFNKIFSTAGIIDGKQIQNTETLAGLLASETLDAIKSSGLGAGQGFTNTDRQFLERAKSGNLEINASTLQQLADLNEKSAQASIDRGNSTIRRIKKAPGMKDVGDQLEEITIPDYQPLNPNYKSNSGSNRSRWNPSLNNGQGGTEAY